VVQQFTHPPVAVVAPRLQHDAEPRSPPLVAVGRVDAQHLDRPGRPQPEPLEDLDGRALPRAVRAEQGDDLAVPGLERDVVQDLRTAVAHPQAVDRQHHGRFPSSSVHERLKATLRLINRQLQSDPESLHFLAKRGNLCNDNAVKRNRVLTIVAMN
jgi:hypothetical protein